MSYSICLIDDNIPANQIDHFDDTELISSSMLRLLLNGDISWSEEELKKLVTELLNNENISLVNAFNNPNFFFNYLNETSFTPQAIVYDYNYHGLETTDSKELLKRILNETFTIVFIYTRIDQSHEIEEMITGPEFKEYKNRLYLIHKEDEDSVTKLIDELNLRNDENFSFKFSQLLRTSSNQVINRILVELGRVSVNQLGYYFKLASEDRRDFVEFLGEKFKNQLVSSDYLEDFDFDIHPDDDVTAEIGIKIWSNRLYTYEKKDKKVRKGDLVIKEEQLFLVITADCDLNKHWYKNFGYVSLVPLHEVTEDNEYLKKQLLLARTETQFKRNLKVSSISNKIGDLTEGPIAVPFVNMGDSYKTYFLFPNELFGLKVDSPKSDAIKNEFLKYSDNFEYKKIGSVSEPFLTPLIQHVLNTLGGYGAPDYPSIIQDEISNKLESLFP